MNIELKKTASFIDWCFTNTKIPKFNTSDDFLGTDLPYYAIAQHYGYKTDLIDFTTCIDVAHCFSIADARTDGIGVIFCLWQSDIDFLIKCIKKNIDRLFSPVKELLIAKNYNPFFSIPIKLSRIHNQQGVFLLDANKMTSQLLYGLLSYSGDNKFFFRQNPKKKKFFMRYLYPASDIVEIEIERHLGRQYATHFWENYSDDYKKIPEAPEQKTLSASLFQSNEWSEYSPDICSTVFLPRAGKDKVRYLLLDESTLEEFHHYEKTLSFVKCWFDDVNKNCVLFFGGEHGYHNLFSEVINDLLTTLFLYKEYSCSDIALALTNTIGLLDSLCIVARESSPIVVKDVFDNLAHCFNNKNLLEDEMDKLRNCICLEDLAKAFYEECYLINLETDSSNSRHVVHSNAMFPLEWLNDITKPYKKKHFEVLHKLWEDGQLPQIIESSGEDGLPKYSDVLKDNLKWDLMLNYVSDPKILFDLEDIQIAFNNFILPWQFVMHRKFTRIYSPSELSLIKIKDPQRYPGR